MVTGKIYTSNGLELVTGAIASAHRDSKPRSTFTTTTRYEGLAAHAVVWSSPGCFIYIDMFNMRIRKKLQLALPALGGSQLDLR